MPNESTEVILRMASVFKSENFTIPNAQQVEEFGITWDPSVHGFDGYINSGFPNFIYPQNSETIILLNDYMELTGILPAHRKFPDSNKQHGHPHIEGYGGKCSQPLLVPK